MINPIHDLLAEISTPNPGAIFITCNAERKGSIALTAKINRQNVRREGWMIFIYQGII
jgi:hypothetical protein